MTQYRNSWSRVSDNLPLVKHSSHDSSIAALTAVHRSAWNTSKILWKRSKMRTRMGSSRTSFGKNTIHQPSSNICARSRTQCASKWYSSDSRIYTIFMMRCSFATTCSRCFGMPRIIIDRINLCTRMPSGCMTCVSVRLAVIIHICRGKHLHKRRKICTGSLYTCRRTSKDGSWGYYIQLWHSGKT
jgi:hypothetical protein